MAVIIDGTTYSGYWKITPDSSSPNTFRISEKVRGIELNSADTTGGAIVLGSDTQNAISITYSSFEDENGNALNTPAKICEYLSIWR